MKKMRLSLLTLGIATAGFLAFRADDAGTIKGTVSPADGAVQAWAMTATDTLKSPVVNGVYEIPGVKMGTYKLVIEAKPPYKNAAKEGVAVADGQTTEVPEIVLEK